MTIGTQQSDNSDIENIESGRVSLDIEAQGEPRVPFPTDQSAYLSHTNHGYGNVYGYNHLNGPSGLDIHDHILSL